MKFLNILFISVIFFNSAFSQIDDDDYTFFGLTRGTPIDVYDFGKITEQNKVAEFTYINNSDNIQKFVSITPIDGVAVVMEKTKVMPKETIKIYVIIDLKYFKQKGDFSKDIGFKLIEKTNFGVKIQKEFFYTIKGEI